MDADLYDEFGNYIGPAIEEEAPEGSEEDSKLMEESELSRTPVSVQRAAPRPGGAALT